MAKKIQENSSRHKALVPIKENAKNLPHGEKKSVKGWVRLDGITPFPFHFEFKSPDVRRIFGIKKERLREWIKFGYIKPSVKKSSGPGTDNIFSTVDLFRLGLFKNLIDLGLNRWIASQWALSLEEKDWLKVNDRKVKFFVIDGRIDRNENWERSVTLNTSKRVPKTTAMFDFALIVNLENIIENIDRKIYKIIG